LSLLYIIDDEKILSGKDRITAMESLWVIEGNGLQPVDQQFFMRINWYPISDNKRLAGSIKPAKLTR